MTNLQTVILTAAILLSAILISRAPEAQTASASTALAVVPRTTVGIAWVVIQDEIWFCDQGKCKKAMQP